MRSNAAATIEPSASTSAVYHVMRRPSATFLVLNRVSGVEPGPGSYGGEVEIAGVHAPCGIIVLDEGQGSEVWCRPRGPLPLLAVGDEAILRFAMPRPTGHR
jgi:hypothetical protein